MNWKNGCVSSTLRSIYQSIKNVTILIKAMYTYFNCDLGNFILNFEQKYPAKALRITAIPSKGKLTNLTWSPERSILNNPVIINKIAATVENILLVKVVHPIARLRSNPHLCR